MSRHPDSERTKAEFLAVSGIAEQPQASSASKLAASNLDFQSEVSKDDKAGKLKSTALVVFKTISNSRAVCTFFFWDIVCAGVPPRFGQPQLTRPSESTRQKGSHEPKPKPRILLAFYLGTHEYAAIPQGVIARDDPRNGMKCGKSFAGSLTDFDPKRKSCSRSTTDAYRWRLTR
jgi:hypothetical protein